jgi:heterodisulfide reductase subunit C
MAETKPKVIPKLLSCKNIEEFSGEIISACYQCEKCTNGCPLTFAMDITPHRVMHSIHLGLIDEVINSDTIWVCASCETCTTHCPNDINISHVMDTFRQLSIQQGVKPSQKQSPIFHASFLSNVRRLGRMHEMTMALDFTLKNAGLKGLSKQARLGMNMIRKGKMKPIPGRLSAGQELKAIFRASEEK